MLINTIINSKNISLESPSGWRLGGKTGCWDVLCSALATSYWVIVKVIQRLWEIPKKPNKYIVKHVKKIKWQLHVKYWQHHQSNYKVITIIIPIFCPLFFFCLFVCICVLSVPFFIVESCVFLKPAGESLLPAWWGKGLGPSEWCNPPLGCPILF